MSDIKLLPEVTTLSHDDLKAYAFKRAERIARETPGEPENEPWDDPEEWQDDAALRALCVRDGLSTWLQRWSSCRSRAVRRDKEEGER